MPIERFNPKAMHTPSGYTHVVRATGSATIYVSGQVGIRPDGSVAEGLEAQAIVAFRNLAAALQAAGADPSDVAKLTTYVVDYSEDAREVLIKARRPVFGDGPLPASTLLGVAALARPTLLIEVEAVAVV